MKSHPSSRTASCLPAVLFAFATWLAPATAAGLPHIVIVYADDLGQGDLSCYNPKAAYRTPRIDRMAAEGIRFTDAHSASTICSPSRYSLFSGQQIYRSTGGGGGAFEGPAGPSYLKPGTLTLGDMLRRQGYRTGIFGKWHVGLTWLDKNGQRIPGGFQTAPLIDYAKSTPLIDGPNARGFDESFITPNCPGTDPLYIYIENGMVPVPADRRHDSKSLPNPGGKWRWDNDAGWVAPGYEFVKADLLFFDKMRSFITAHLKDHPDRPFFSVLSTQIAHAPVLPASEFAGATHAGPRGDFLHQLDVLVGRLIDLLQAHGIDDQTLILFHADNGAETQHVVWMREDHNHDPVGGWRGMKRDGWEGGHRVPFIARWPAKIPPRQVTAQMMNTTDIFATLASATGSVLPDDVAVDSFDLLPAMLGKQPDDQPIRPPSSHAEFSRPVSGPPGELEVSRPPGIRRKRIQGDARALRPPRTGTQGSGATLQLDQRSRRNHQPLLQGRSETAGTPGTPQTTQARRPQRPQGSPAGDESRQPLKEPSPAHRDLHHATLCQRFEMVGLAGFEPTTS